MIRSLFEKANIDNDRKAQQYLTKIDFQGYDESITLYIDFSKLYLLSEYVRNLIYERDELYIDLTEFHIKDIKECIFALHGIYNDNNMNSEWICILQKLCIDTNVLFTDEDIINMAFKGDKSILKIYNLGEKFHEYYEHDTNIIAQDKCLDFFKLYVNCNTRKLKHLCIFQDYLYYGIRNCQYKIVDYIRSNFYNPPVTSLLHLINKDNVDYFLSKLNVSFFSMMDYCLPSIYKQHEEIFTKLMRLKSIGISTIPNNITIDDILERCLLSNSNKIVTYTNIIIDSFKLDKKLVFDACINFDSQNMFAYLLQKDISLLTNSNLHQIVDKDHYKVLEIILLSDCMTNEQKETLSNYCTSKSKYKMLSKIRPLSYIESLYLKKEELWSSK